MELSPWHPHHPPIYDLGKSYQQNLLEGPFFEAPIPPREETAQRFDFLGFQLRSLIGVPAGPLLNAKWIALASKLGFDILTYKTIRSEAHPSHPLPNVAYIDQNGRQTQAPAALEELTITNSFGMPSQPPDFLLKDIGEANDSLSEGQILIVSIVGTPRNGIGFADDFVRTAALARAAGARIIEANFSCPNVKKKEGILYENPETVHEYASLIAKAIHPVPLILKVGVFSDIRQMKSVFLAAARAKVRGISGINSVNMPIHPPLDAHRPTSGICGSAIRTAALNFTRDAAQIIREHQLDLALVSCGGILLAEHFDPFFEAGANAAMSAAGMMWDPYLALRYHARSLSHS